MNKEITLIPKVSEISLLKDQVYEIIKKSIIDLSLFPTEQLVEQRFAEKLGVSKSPVREALQRLEKEGLVYTLPFKGCFVSKITRKDITDVFQLREALETFSFKYACQNLKGGEIRKASKILLEGEKALDQNDISHWHATSNRFHDFFIFKSQNERVVKVFLTLSDHLNRYRNIVIRILGRAQKSHQQHKLIMEAVEQKNLVEVERRISTHLHSILEEFLESNELKSFFGPPTGMMASHPLMGEKDLPYMGA